MHRSMYTTTTLTEKQVTERRRPQQSKGGNSGNPAVCVCVCVRSRMCDCVSVCYVRMYSMCAFLYFCVCCFLLATCVRWKLVSFYNFTVYVWRAVFSSVSPLQACEEWFYERSLYRSFAWIIYSLISRLSTELFTEDKDWPVRLGLACMYDLPHARWCPAVKFHMSFLHLPVKKIKIPMTLWVRQYRLSPNLHLRYSCSITKETLTNTSVFLIFTEVTWLEILFTLCFCSNGIRIECKWLHHHIAS